MIVYIDADCKAHVSPTESRAEYEDSFFDNKCTDLIESYRYVPAGETWTREDGEEFTGRMIAPWRDIRQYDGEQQQYLLYQLAQYESALTEIEAVLKVNT